MSDTPIVRRVEMVGVVYAPDGYLFGTRELRLDPMHLIAGQQDDYASLCGTALFYGSLSSQKYVTVVDGERHGFKLCPRCHRALKRMGVEWAPVEEPDRH